MKSFDMKPRKPEQTLKQKIYYKIFYYPRFFLFIAVRLFYIFCYTYGIWELPLPKKTILYLSDEYVEKWTKKFLDTYQPNHTDNMYNSNVDTCFYDKCEYKEAVEVENNDLEKKWRTRILMENTPRGNVIMYYDAFKQGFVYYSDNSNIPYPIMNAVVMKYVLLYRCRDFFVDENIVPEDNKSPFIDLYINEKPAKKTKESDDSNNAESMSISTQSDVFAKLKTYNTVSSKIVSTENPDNLNNESNKTEPEKTYARNRIVHLGKISNFRFIQSQKRPVGIQFTSSLLDGLKTESLVQKQVFSYKDYKKLKDTISIVG